MGVCGGEGCGQVQVYLYNGAANKPLNWTRFHPFRAMPTPAHPPQHKQPSPHALVRAVASSTAVETGQKVAQLEQKLRHPREQFAHIKLAR